MRGRLEERQDGVERVVVMVDYGERPPLVEGSAWMRDPTPDEVAHGELLALRNFQIGVLIVERVDRRARLQLAHILALSLDQARKRELDNVGAVPLSETKQGQATHCQRQQRPPRPHSLLQPS